jgi:K+-sensing histidine kinase KdpD
MTRGDERCDDTDRAGGVLVTLRTWLPGGQGGATISPAAVRYATAVLMSAAALGGTLLLRPATDRDTSLLFVAAIMVIGWYGGLGPALTATLASVVAINHYFVQPEHSSLPVTVADAIRLAVFATVGVSASWLNNSLRAARQRAETSG